MAEIKSAIELAMEKTKDLVMDDREKRSLALKELAAGMLTIYRRYREGLSGDEETKAQLDALECDSAGKRKIALDIFADEFAAGDDIAGMAPLFSFICFMVDEKASRELLAIRKECLGELEKIRSSIRSRITEDLAASGIRGDSVEPNIEAWPIWKEASADVRRTFGRQIEKWKEGLT
ncbi:MAG: hypothetical protein A4E61_00996 [Syntrophorhabdus sp. PtaB.Bin184]|jgi:hypothetical protein|nr:MAG: hypothetical protein A4E61_00996 [Syntrophorhabdus sp. PtaB.Bin184]